MTVKADHRAPHQAINERLGQLVSERVDDFSADARGLVADGPPEFFVARSEPEDFGRARAVDLQQSRSALRRQVALHLERFAERVEGDRRRAGQRRARGRAGRGSPAEIFEEHFDRLFGEASVGRELAADEREESAHTRGAYEVASRDGGLFARRGTGERAHAGVRVEHVAARESG